MDQFKAWCIEWEIQEVCCQFNQLMQEKIVYVICFENFEFFIKEVEDKLQGYIDWVILLDCENEEMDGLFWVKKWEVSLLKECIVDIDIIYWDVVEKMSVVFMAFNEKNIEFIWQQNKVLALQCELSFCEK